MLKINYNLDVIFGDIAKGDIFLVGSPDNTYMKISDTDYEDSAVHLNEGHEVPFNNDKLVTPIPWAELNLNGE